MPSSLAYLFFISVCIVCCQVVLEWSSQHKPHDQFWSLREAPLTSLITVLIELLPFGLAWLILGGPCHSQPAYTPA